jgi:uncharacterized protein YecT (DUF1311 family)
MKKLLTILLLGLSTSITYAQSQREMTQESDKSYKKADKELTLVINKIAAKYAKNTVFIKALRESQSLWIKFRSAEINMMFPGANGPKFYGSAYPMCANLVAEGITKKRITQLNKWLKPASDEDICTGSIGDTAAD